MSSSPVRHRLGQRGGQRHGRRPDHHPADEAHRLPAAVRRGGRGGRLHRRPDHAADHGRGGLRDGRVPRRALRPGRDLGAGAGAALLRGGVLRGALRGQALQARRRAGRRAAAARPRDAASAGTSSSRSSSSCSACSPATRRRCARWWRRCPACRSRCCARRTRAGIHWKTVLEALEEGARNALAVAMACACAGIVIACVTITGLGIVFTQLVVALAQDQLILALMLTAHGGHRPRHGHADHAGLHHDGGAAGAGGDQARRGRRRRRTCSRSTSPSCRRSRRRSRWRCSPPQAWPRPTCGPPASPRCARRHPPTSCPSCSSTSRCCF